MRGKATTKLSTDELMELFRDDSEIDESRLRR
jgi:hypothetical protein